MDQSKAAMLQMQVKHNAADLEDYMKGLDDWEKDIKIKDSTLEAHKPILKEVNVIINDGNGDIYTGFMA